MALHTQRTDPRRARPRRVLNRPVWLFSSTSAKPTMGLLINISHSGAKLSIQPGSELPDTFEMAMSTDRTVTRSCQVVWRDGSAMGVEFVDKKPTRVKGRAAH